MDAVFTSGLYNFIYTVFVAPSSTSSDHNLLCGPRLDELNTHYVPTCYWDAGYYVNEGWTQTNAMAFTVASGPREVPELDLDVSVNWLGNATIEVQVDIVNRYYVNLAPETPSAPTSTDNIGVANHTYTFSTTVVDPEANQIYCQWDWGNGELSDWLGPFNSGETAEGTYLWATDGTYSIKVRAKDDSDLEGPWSDVAEITLTGKCGDANNDGNINIGDAVFMGNYIFSAGSAPVPYHRGDANCDNGVNIGDVVSLVNFIFNNGSAPGCQ